MNDDIHDDQLEAFLRGDDALSRRLRAMPGSEPPAALDAAIRARARQAVQQQARPPAANDPASPAWRVPAGLAAMLLVGVLTHRTWVETSQMEHVDAAAARAQPQRAIPAEVEQPSPPPPPMPMASEHKARAAAKPKPTAHKPAPESEVQEEARPAPQPFATPEAAMPAPQAGSIIAHGSNVAPPVQVRHYLAPVMPAPAAPAPVLAPAAWLGLIEHMLAAGQTAGALAEWTAFRAAHPDYPVDPALEEKISEFQPR